MPTFGPGGGGQGRSALSRTKGRLPGSGETYIDIPYRENPWGWVDKLWDFDGRPNTFTVTVPLFSANGAANTVATTGASIGKAIMPRGGYLLSAQIVGNNTLAVDATEIVTFSVTNKLASGAGAVAMLAATAPNTTTTTTGSAWTANVTRTLVNNGTAANLNVAPGDTVEVAATVTGTAANAVDFPVAILTFATLPDDLQAIITRIATTPRVGPVANTANGEIIALLTATNEAQTAGWYAGDQVGVPANKGWIWEALVKFGTVGAAEVAVVGMGSAYNATLSSIVSNAWFRLTASMVLTAETDDGTSDRDAQALSSALTVVAGTYYLLRIDASNPRAVHFWVNNTHKATLSAAAWAVTDLMQPMAIIQKASGTGVPSITCDFQRLIHRRF